jgi:RNA polymerase sigma factor (sigma-70 family)
VTKTAPSPILHLIRRVVEDQRLKDLPDQELLRSFQAAHDKAAFDTLLRRHGSMVLDVCRNVLGNEQEAEDAFQVTFLVLARKAGAIRKAASVGSWLYGVAYRTATKAQACAAKRRKYESRNWRQTANKASNDLTWREVQQLLHAELNRLPERNRAALVHCYLEGKSQDQAARLLGVSRAALKKRLEVGRALLAGRPPAEVERTYQQALSVLRKLAADFPNRPDYQAQLAVTYRDLGRFLQGIGRTQEAERALAQARAIQEKLPAAGKGQQLPR